MWVAVCLAIFTLSCSSNMGKRRWSSFGAWGIALSLWYLEQQYNHLQEVSVLA